MNAVEIKEMRTKLGLSQEALAHLVGVSLQTIGRWERATAKPSRLAVEKLNKLTATV